MRVAALYDIHGNLPALEAVLDDIAQTHVDLILVGGDVVAGPMPRETLTCLLNLTTPVHFIQGNADREIVAQLAGTNTGELPDNVREIARWVAQQLLPEHTRLLASWPATVQIAITDLGQVLFCHATPRSDTELFTRLTPEAQLLPMFAGLTVPLVVCGHTHMQFDRIVGGIRVVNAGSVGMPYGEPGAYCCCLAPAFNSDIRATIAHTLLHVFSRQTIHKRRTLRLIMSCTSHQKRKHLRCLPRWKRNHPTCYVQKAAKRGIIQPEADHAWFVESTADDTSLIEHLAKRRCASK